MRLKIFFVSLQNQVKNLPAENSRYFLSFIKKTFQCYSSQLFESLFSSKKTKPYVFSVWLGKNFKEKKISNEVNLIFSTGDFKIFAAFWNGLLKLKQLEEDYLSINSTKFGISQISLLPQIKIYSNKIMVKTLGVCILTDPEQNANNFEKWFVIPKKENLEIFNHILLERVKHRYEIITNTHLTKADYIQISQEHLEIKECIVPHYNGYLKGFKGKFLLEGSPNLLQFVYDYGLGVRTGQGFGMLEVIKQ